MDARAHRIYHNEHNTKRCKWVASRQYISPVLDIGCAEGFITAAIPADRVVAVDVRNRLELSDAEFVEASVYALPFPDASFPTVCAFEMLEHLHEPEKALAEIRRVCSQLLYVTVPAHGAMPPGATKGHVQDFEDISALVEVAGFRVLSVTEQWPFVYLEGAVS